ncbi:hypothetical protein ASPVEDRAFT_79826 [Aspergillus versicolor CBS 583.65]|uniref:DUF7703 domain-containing protein n=1 Tax=Aspergillus versicolor CBS 583.65 TaxID=1036611 RepID=A0A1L9P9K4_ASPVE|nr:uncharacterized protein ASPVEDRAFT_79826 [Aspergillus versicolor CBS 583.65]OJI98165.1 hypothetical protein ASPVEDRAFT_79826 [Aspergillus versicolor CBS 583.65]
MSLIDVGNNLNSQIPTPVTYVVTSVLSIALYNVIELTFLLFFTFKRRAGLYFWSFLFSSWGVAVYSVGLILKDFHVADNIPAFYASLIVFGWCAMVTGQSMVLYSRLHLIVRRRIILRSVLTMIIVNAIVLHIPAIVLCYGANSTSYPHFVYPYAVFERIQVTLFFVQESIISLLYLYYMSKLFYMGGTLSEAHGQAGRRLMIHLIYMNLAVLGLDVCILVLEFTGRYASQTAAKGLIYSVKLKLEFNILNRLVDVARRSSHSSGPEYGDGPGAQDQHGHGHEHEAHGVNVCGLWKCTCPWALFASRVKKAIGERRGSG